MKRFVFISLVALILGPVLTKAEVEYVPELRQLSSADIAVEAAFVKNDGRYFWIKVLTVYKKGKYAVKQYDFLKVKETYGDYMVKPYDFSAFKRARFYLRSEENQEWSLTTSTQSAHRIFNDTAYYDLETSQVKLPVAVFNRCYKEFVANYELDSFGRYISTYPEIEKSSIMASNAFIAAYEKDAIIEPMEHVPEEFIPEPKEAALWSCGIADVPAVYKQNGTMDELYHYLKDSVVNPPEVQEMGIQGVSIIRFTVNTDGSQSDFEILRSLGPSFDEETLRLIQAIPTWKPAEQRGRTVACLMILPVRFKMKY